MLDLIVLLSFALGVTAVLGLLLAGFVWVPWFIGVLLVALLVALLKLSGTDQPAPELEVAESFGQSSLEPKRSGLGSGSRSLGNSPSVMSSPEAQSTPAPNLVYRGVKYRRPKVSAAPAGQEGLYRGQPWKR